MIEFSSRRYNTFKDFAKAGRIKPLESTELARKVVDIASDKHASDIVLLDLKGLTLIADYFVICSGTSERQIKAIVDDLEETLKKEDNISPLHVEGTTDSGWVLIDYGGVIVHVFSPRERDYYRIEKIWSDAPIVLRML